MFTGIIESLGTVKSLKKKGSNIDITVSSSISTELKVDQSVSHNGVCLTVVNVVNGTHTVTAVRETLNKSNLGNLSVGDTVNLERAMLLGGRLDGHLVQGHVDGTATIAAIEDQGGSMLITFTFDPQHRHLLISKGSVAINGISLTVIDPTDSQFQVTVIPYTWQHTNLNALKAGDMVNLEFDMIGKYVLRARNML